MNLEELQKQIDSRCPCFALPLEECLCEFNEEDYSGLVVLFVLCAVLGIMKSMKWVTAQIAATPLIISEKKMNYKEYIVSSEWRSKHKGFLKRSHYRCAMFPFIKVGKKARYNVHHMKYENLGSERLWVDVVCLCPFAHSFIIHGILSGFKRPSQQKSYPNVAQRLAHFWCCQPVMIRGALLITLLINLVG